MSSEEFFLKKMKGVVRVGDNNKIKKHKGLVLKKIIKSNTKKQNTEPQNEIKTKEKKQAVFEKNIIRKKTKTNTHKKIDFHGLSVISAENLFTKTIIESYNKQNRCILFVTGKGLYRPDGLSEGGLTNKPKLFYGKIRSSFLDWVKNPNLSKYILSFERAGTLHGGDGAFFVHLRKKKV